ncbi:MAG: prolyl-tRNA synthetase associated domain-containing protein [Bacteroidales bacterium]|nr:prolyl-tRNA synthetase associated domain-containing protein [Bacteroidales bacterium]
MNDRSIVFDYLKQRSIEFEIIEHPAAPTISEAMKYWKDIEATHCKNLFFRNHKGNKHYLVIFDAQQQLAIHDLEKRLQQGKLSFASEKRMAKYLAIQAGSVSPFGLINDKENHVHLFLDSQLLKAQKISFHPNDNTASIVLSFSDFLRYLESIGNSFEFIELYE